jgi:transposase InsO family protein
MVADYNTFAPHSSLGMRSPIEYRQAMEPEREEVPV